MFLYLVDNQLITRLSLDLTQMVITALNWVKLKERTKIVAGLVEFLFSIIMMAI